MAHVNFCRDSLSLNVPEVIIHCPVAVRPEQEQRHPEETFMKSIHTEKYRQIGLKIAYYRKLRGLTQEELAEQVGLTPAYIGHLEAPNISKALSLDTLFDIADALHVDAQKFLVFEES